MFIKGSKTKGKPLKKYNCDKSCQGRYVKFAYLDGPVEGHLTTLSVEFQEHIFQCPMIVAEKVSKSFEDLGGLVGLSPLTQFSYEPTFIQTLIDNRLIDRYAFGINFNFIQANRSFLVFGSPNQQYFRGNLNRYKVVSSRLIYIYFGWIKIGKSESLHIRSALLDTGNTCISIENKYESIILEQFNVGKNICFFSPEDLMFSLLLCVIKDFDLLPSLTFNIQGDQYVIEKEFYLKSCFMRNGVHFCKTLIESMNLLQGNQVILGDGFFNRFYTHFDYEGREVGIAYNNEHITVEDVLAVPFEDNEE